MAQSMENSFVIMGLSVLIIVYMYLLLSPSQPRVPKIPRNFVISRNTKESFDKFMKEYRDSMNWTYSYRNDFESGSWNSSFEYSDREFSEFGNAEGHDDFFLDRTDDRQVSGKSSSIPNTPSEKFRCQQGWVSMRSELSKHRSLLVLLLTELFIF